jgi:hypothetical protein
MMKNNFGRWIYLTRVIILLVICNPDKSCCLLVLDRDLGELRPEFVVNGLVQSETRCGKFLGNNLEKFNYLQLFVVIEDLMQLNIHQFVIDYF